MTWPEPPRPLSGLESAGVLVLFGVILYLLRSVFNDLMGWLQ